MQRLANLTGEAKNDFMCEAKTSKTCLVPFASFCDFVMIFLVDKNEYAYKPFRQCGQIKDKCYTCSDKRHICAWSLVRRHMLCVVRKALGLYQFNIEN